MKRLIEKGFLLPLLAVAAFMAASVCAVAQTGERWGGIKGDIRLFLASDLGRNGYYDQQPVAELMGEMAGETGPECVVAAGDIFHYLGVGSVGDPLWTTNYEQVYSHPELMVDWLPVCGNHEYKGNTQALLDYSKVSRRWMMPARYYSRVFTKKGTSVRVVLIDTAPLISKYRNDAETYPDACRQDDSAQLAWLDETLRGAREDWVVVVGHHPVYADTDKSEVERADMQERVLPILRKYGNVAIYACGHIHNFQHIRKKGDSIDYVVNTSASQSRGVEAIDGTVYCSSETGFSVISATKTQLNLYMIGKKGDVLHTVAKSK